MRARLSAGEEDRLNKSAGTPDIRLVGYQSDAGVRTTEGRVVGSDEVDHDPEARSSRGYGLDIENEPGWFKKYVEPVSPSKIPVDEPLEDERPEEDLFWEDCHEEEPTLVFCIDLFGGISAIRHAHIASGHDVRGHIHVETKHTARKIVKAWFPNCETQCDIRDLAKDSVKWAADTWTKIRDNGVIEIWFGCGFPCRELSIAGRRGGLNVGETARFHEAVILCAELMRQRDPEEDAPVYHIWENVASMSKDMRELITLELRSKVDDDFEVVSICSSSMTQCRRPRLWWTNFHVCKGSKET